MKITVGTEDFLRILSRTQGVVDRRHSMAILTNILLEAGEADISAVATDLEVSLKQTCPAKVSEPGSAAISARKIFEIVREANADEISLETTENRWVTVSYGRSKFKLMGIDPGDHPGMPAPGEAEVATIELAAGELSEMIGKTIFAVSTDDARSNLSGVHLDRGSKKGSLRLVATDGHRLALIERKVEGQAPKDGVILPRKGLAEMAKLLAEDTGKIKLSFSDREALIDAGGCTLSMRLVEGNFPDYKQVVPKEAPNIIRVGRDALLQSVRRVSLLSSDRAHGVRFGISEDRLEISASNPDLGEAKEDLEVSYQGPEIEIGFNARYLIEVLGVLPEGGAIEIGLGDQLSPGVLRGDEPGYQYVVMPMRI